MWTLGPCGFSEWEKGVCAHTRHPGSGRHPENCARRPLLGGPCPSSWRAGAHGLGLTLAPLLAAALDSPGLPWLVMWLMVSVMSGHRTGPGGRVRGGHCSAPAFPLAGARTPRPYVRVPPCADPSSQPPPSPGAPGSGHVTKGLAPMSSTAPAPSLLCGLRWGTGAQPLPGVLFSQLYKNGVCTTPASPPLGVRSR